MLPIQEGHEATVVIILLTMLQYICMHVCMYRILMYMNVILQLILQMSILQSNIYFERKAATVEDKQHKLIQDLCNQMGQHLIHD